MTRWVAQTHQNYVSVTPYNHTATYIHGFQGTHQPAIWMGESGQAVVVPGVGKTVHTMFEDRGLTFNNESQVITPSYYSVELDIPDGGGSILAEQSASKFAFPNKLHSHLISSPQLRASATSDSPSRQTHPPTSHSRPPAAPSSPPPQRTPPSPTAPSPSTPSGAK